MMGFLEEMETEDRGRSEDWLEKQMPMPLEPEDASDGCYGKCGRCGHRVIVLLNSRGEHDVWTPKWCPACGQRIKRWAGDE